MKALSRQELAQIEDLIAQMTTQEKVGQLNQLPLSAQAENLAELAEQGLLGSIVLAYTPFAGREQRESEVALRKELQRIALHKSRLHIPLLFGRDVIHGHHTVFPVPLMQANSWNPKLVEQAAALAAAEARQEEIHWTFAPMMDISRDPRWGRIIEGFGEDPLLASEMAKAAVNGFQAFGIAACAKHFIGYGAAEGGRDYNTTELSDYTLRNCYLPPFAAAVQAGVLTVMASFNDIQGEAVTASLRLLTGLLKEELRFEGFVVSDWNAVAQLVEQGVAADRRAAARLAFMAGIDMDMVSGCFIEHLPALVENGSVPIERLNDAVRRVLRVKMQLGLFEPPAAKTPMPAPALHEALHFAEKAAQSAMVLLKNEGRLLPLANEAGPLVLLGPFMRERRSLLGSWTLDGREEDTATLEEALRLAAPSASLLFLPACHSADEVRAVQTARAVIVALGEHWDDTGEARGSATLRLPAEQLTLLQSAAALNKNIVAVVFAGRPVLLNQVAGLARAVLYAGHGGTKTAAAAAGLLMGKQAPCGKLCVTFPQNAGQLPLYYNHRPAGRRIDEYFGTAEFRNYQDASGSPLYPFGFGLQYTEYRYTNLFAAQHTVPYGEDVILWVEVTNIGSWAGTETVQCYLSPPPSPFVRPVRELKQFRQVELKSGECRAIYFKLLWEELSYSRPDGTRETVPGRYTAWVGGSCTDVHPIIFYVSEKNGEEGLREPSKTAYSE